MRNLQCSAARAVENGQKTQWKNEESAIWKDARLNTLSRDAQLKYIDIEGTRVVTNNRCVADQNPARQGGERRDVWIIGWKMWKMWKSAKIEEHRD